MFVRNRPDSSIAVEDPPHLSILHDQAVPVGDMDRLRHATGCDLLRYSVLICVETSGLVSLGMAAPCVLHLASAGQTVDRLLEE